MLDLLVSLAVLGVASPIVENGVFSKVVIVSGPYVSSGVNLIESARNLIVSVSILISEGVSLQMLLQIFPMIVN